MRSSIERALLDPETRRNVVDNVKALDREAQTFDVLVIAFVCALVDRRFAEADGFFDLIAAKVHATGRPGIEPFQLLMYNANAVKATLYADGAVAAHQCAKLLALMELLDPERHDPQPARPPAGSPRAFDYAPGPLDGVEADIIARKYFYGPGSRLHDIGWRTATGLRRGGWDTRVADLHHDIGPGPGALEAFAERRPGRRRRFAFIDLFGFFGADTIVQGASFLQRIRPHYDAVVCMIFDAWTPGLDMLMRVHLPYLDLIWSVHPHSYIFADPAVAARTTFIPVMTGIDPEIPAPPAAGGDARLSFTGSIEASNIHRMYWYLLSRRYPEFLHFSVSDVRDDGASVEASQAMYLDRLRRTRHCLNLCRRANGDRILTGRAFEVPAMNRLLVQEYCEDVRSYFSPGEHFVEFGTADELLVAIDDVRSRPERFQRMAEDAHRFFRERYADPAIVRHLSHRLG